MAEVTLTPSEVQVGDTVKIDGTGFAADSVVQIEIPEYGITSEVVSDAAGDVSSDDLADRAIATLVSTANPAAADTVTIGTVTYTFRAAVDTIANEVLIGADAEATLANLKAAVNLAAGSGVTYGSLTVVNPDVTAGAADATTLRLYAKVRGVAGNDIVSTEASTALSFSATTFDLGSAASGINALTFVPTRTIPFTVNLSDGTTEASARATVWTN